MKSIDGTPVMRNIFESKYKLAAEVDSNNTIKEYINHTNVNSADYIKVGSAHYRIIKDHLGSPRLVVNTTDGSIAQKMSYNEWGKVIEDTNPGFQPFGFAGGLYDPDTQLVKFGARDYDGRVGRWLSKDPIRFDGGDTNLYGYVLNDPVNLIDTNGKHPAAVAAVGAGAFAGAVTGAITGFAGSNSCSFAGKLGDAEIGLMTGAVGGAIAGLGFVTGGIVGTAAGIAGSMATGAGADAISLFGDFGGSSGGGSCTPPPPCK